MGWQAEQSGAGAANSSAAEDGPAAAQFLLQAVRDEVDNAQVGPVVVLAHDAAGPPALYAAATVQGPLRCYLATAWGPSGHLHGKHIVSYPDAAAAQAALDHLIEQRTAPAGAQGGYRRLGTYHPA